MIINKTHTFSFSPTGTTAKVINTISENLENSSFTEITNSSVCQNISDTDLVVVGIPVFGGRVPSLALERLQELQGNNTPAVAVVTYGNRAYDDALLELSHFLEQHGFVVVAAASFVTEHSIARTIASGRPDLNDLNTAKSFAKQVVAKLASMSTPSSISVNGNFPYKVYAGASYKPKTTTDCTGCGVCGDSCPTNAIILDGISRTCDELCITCMRCVAICPMNARTLDDAVISQIESRLSAIASEPKKPEIVL